MKKTCALALTGTCIVSRQKDPASALCVSRPPSTCHGFSALDPMTERIAQVAPDKQCSAGRAVCWTGGYPFHLDPHTKLFPSEGNQIKLKNPAKKMKTIRILVVDDESGQRETIKMILPLVLRKLGVADSVTVQTASSGAEALELLEGQEFDLVITDFHMSGMNGDELTGEIKSRWPQTPVIIMSALAGEEEALKAGASGHLTKPAHPEHYGKTVKGVLKLD